VTLGTPNGRSSGRQTSAAAHGGATDVASRYGFRRVEHVHIVLGNGSSLAMVTGVCHRYPRSVRVPLHVATRFVAAGAPLTVEGDVAHEAAGV
jgi:hypothetical protein